MTSDEARADPAAARQRHRLIRVVTVFELGTHSLLVKRKARGPAPLAWATCDIGLHHVHHLNARVPHGTC